MRFYRQVTKDGKTILTISVWGEDGHEADLKDLLESAANELLANYDEDE